MNQPWRWPHIHFELSSSLAPRHGGEERDRELAYAPAGHRHSITHLSRTSLATDNVFSNGASPKLATATGDVTSGMTAALTVAV